jgi:hypothetical protein
MRLRNALVFVALGAAACSLVVSTSDLQGGPEATGDGGASSSGGGSSSGASSSGASSSGASSSGDSGADVIKKDAGSGSFCADNPGHTVCVSFDDDAGFSKAGHVAGPSATLTVVPQGLSLPNAMRSFVLSSADSYARYELPVPVALKSARVEADVKVCAPDAGYATDFISTISIFCSVPQGNSGALLHFTNGGYQGIKASTPSGGGAVTQQTQSLNLVADGNWHHVVVEGVTGAAGYAKFEVDGTPTMLGGGFFMAAATTCQVNIGVYSSASAGSAPCETLYDNVLIDWQ